MRLAAPVEGGKGGSVRFGGDPGTSLSRAVPCRFDSAPRTSAPSVFSPGSPAQQTADLEEIWPYLNVVAPAA